MKRNNDHSPAGRYETLLLITAAIWGTGFVAQRLGMQNLGPFSYNAARFLVGALALVPVLFFRKVTMTQLRAALPSGLAAGTVLAVAAGFQPSGWQSGVHHGPLRRVGADSGNDPGAQDSAPNLDRRCLRARRALYFVVLVGIGYKQGRRSRTRKRVFLDSPYPHT